MQRQMGTTDGRSPWLLCRTCPVHMGVLSYLGWAGRLASPATQGPHVQHKCIPPPFCILCFWKDFCNHLPHGPHRIAPLLGDSCGDPVPISICPKSYPTTDPVQVPNLPLGLLCSLMKGSQPAQRK